MENYYVGLYQNLVSNSGNFFEEPLDQSNIAMVAKDLIEFALGSEAPGSGPAPEEKHEGLAPHPAYYSEIFEKPLRRVILPTRVNLEIKKFKKILFTDHLENGGVNDYLNWTVDQKISLLQILRKNLPARGKNELNIKSITDDFNQYAQNGRKTIQEVFRLIQKWKEGFPNCFCRNPALKLEFYKNSIKFFKDISSSEEPCWEFVADVFENKFQPNSHESSPRTLKGGSEESKEKKEEALLIQCDDSAITAPLSGKRPYVAVQSPKETKEKNQKRRKIP